MTCPPVQPCVCSQLCCRLCWPCKSAAMAVIGSYPPNDIQSIKDYNTSMDDTYALCTRTIHVSSRTVIGESVGTNSGWKEAWTLPGVEYNTLATTTDAQWCSKKVKPPQVLQELMHMRKIGPRPNCRLQYYIVEKSGPVSGSAGYSASFFLQCTNLGWDYLL